MRIKLIIIVTFSFIILCGKSESSVISPQDLSIFYLNNTEYVRDIVQFKTSEYYQTPLEFHKNKKGDCEDYGLHSYTVLDYNGYEAHMYSIFFRDTGHVVTVFKQFGYYNIFDTGHIIYTKEKKPIEAVKKIYIKWRVICKFKPIKYGKITLIPHLLSHRLITFKLLKKDTYAK